MKEKLFFNYKEIKKLSLAELADYSTVIRNQLIKKITNNTGHFSSSLGCVEIIMAMHYVFDALNDNFIFDIGHQSGAHKFLTDRHNNIMEYHNTTNSVFLDYKNNLDKYDAGHSSTAIAIATGMRIADKTNNKNNHSISLIGDASFNGLAFSSWNNLSLSTNNIVIINDNDMSITKTVGILHSLFKVLKLSHKNIFNPEFIVKNKGYYEFDDFIIVSNVDGHNLAKLISLLEGFKKQSKPVIIHAVTIKGKGYPLAEKDKTGDFHYFKSDKIDHTYVSILEQQLIELAKDNNFALYNPATIKGSGLTNLLSELPEQTFDVGINEDTALLLACGSALKKLPSFVAIYSSFFQRAYDQLNHDVNRLNLNVNIILNKTGLHAIGETHHGIYDINLSRNLDNIVIVEANSHGLQNQLLKWAYDFSGPTIIRSLEDKIKYPALNNNNLSVVKFGEWFMPKITSAIKNIIISYGQLYNLALDFSKKNHNTIVINAIFIKPLDKITLLKIKDYNLIVLEEQLPNSGIGSMINDFYLEHNIKTDLSIIGLDKKVLKQAYGKNLYQKANFDKLNIISRLNKLINGKS